MINTILLFLKAHANALIGAAGAIIAAVIGGAFIILSGNDNIDTELPANITEELKIKQQLENCLAGKIIDCKKIQSRFETAGIGCSHAAKSPSESEGLVAAKEKFKLLRYCGNMKTTQDSISSLLENMYLMCSQSIQSEQCNLAQSNLNASVSNQPLSYNLDDLVKYLSTYN